MAFLSENRDPDQSFFPQIGYGLGLRSPHFKDVLGGQASVDWFEAISENFMGIEDGSGGRPIQILEEVRENFEVVLHGVSLNIGSTDPLNFNYLNRLKTLADRINPVWISDHLCWTGVDGENLHDLLPLPYTTETVNHVVERIQRCQEFLGRRIVIENVSSYVSFNHSEMREWEFISEVISRADCGLLLDVNNIYVNAINHDFDASDFLSGIPKERIAQIHLAGHSKQGTHLIDTHDHAVAPEVWTLYRDAIRRFGNISTMVEWDAQIPDFQTLQNEVFKAKNIQENVCARKQFQNHITA